MGIVFVWSTFRFCFASFGFQEQLAENLSQDLDTITRSGSALYFRAALHDRWAVLNEFNDYPHMLKPLVIQES